MKKLHIALLAAAASAPGYAIDNVDVEALRHQFAVADSVATDSVAADTVKFVFTDIKVIPTTPVKDQNKSGTCWCFAGTSMFEDEIVRLGGKERDLSEMFTVRQCYLDKADRYVRMYGQTNFGAGGSIMDVPYVWARYGALPESVYSGLNYGEENTFTANSTPCSRPISTLWSVNPTSVFPNHGARAMRLSSMHIWARCPRPSRSTDALIHR